MLDFRSSSVFNPPSSALPLLTRRTAKFFLLTLAGTGLLTLSAKVQVPFWPVPMTMQTVAVIMLAMLGGARLGTATVMLYLIEGAIGLPVFAGTPERGIGLSYMVGPTGGYLAGFAAAALVAGFLAERGWNRTVSKALVANALGTAIILALGTVWLAFFVGMSTAISVGLTPFLLTSAVKIGLGGVIVPLLSSWRLHHGR